MGLIQITSPSVMPRDLFSSSPCPITPCIACSKVNFCATRATEICSHENFSKSLELADPAKKIETINTKLEFNQSNHKLIFLKGRAQLMINQYEKAASTFLDALAIKIDENYLNGLGHAYTKLNQLDKALAAYNKAISINNKNSYAYFNSGLLLENQGLNRQAADYFYSAGTSSLLVKDFKMANNAYNALQRLSNQENYITKKSKKLKELIAELSVFNDNNFKIVNVNTNGN